MSKLNLQNFLFLASFSLLVFSSLQPLYAQQNTLTWDDCVAEAFARHPDLLAAKEKIVQAAADADIAKSVSLPQVSSQLSAKKAKAAGAEKSDETYAYTITGEQLLFDGFKTSAEIQAAAKIMDAQVYNYTVTSSDIRLNLRIAFAGLLRAQQLISLTEEIAKRRKENFELIQVRYEAGREHKGAVLTAQADLAQAEFEVSQAKRNLVLAQQDLSRQLGREEYSAGLTVTGLFEISEPVDQDPDCGFLADNTPFLNELIAKKEAARFNLDAARADFFPEVFLSGSFGKTRTGGWPPQNESWSGGVTVSLPLFEGGNKTARLSKTKSQWIEAQETQRSGRDGVLYTLEKTWKDFQDAHDIVSVKKIFLDAAMERAQISNAQYSSGLTTFDDWIIIENNLVDAKKAYLDAQENLLIAEAYWIQAKGGTLEYVQQ